MCDYLINKLSFPFPPKDLALTLVGWLKTGFICISLQVVFSLRNYLPVFSQPTRVKAKSFGGKGKEIQMNRILPNSQLCCVEGFEERG